MLDLLGRAIFLNICKFKTLWRQHFTGILVKLTARGMMRYYEPNSMKQRHAREQSVYHCRSSNQFKLSSRVESKWNKDSGKEVK